jgi:hypothetical protein
MAIKGYWRLNGNSNDASGNSNNGTDYVITYSQANGQINQGAKFVSASKSYISLGLAKAIIGNATSPRSFAISFMMTDIRANDKVFAVAPSSSDGLLFIQSDGYNATYGGYNMYFGIQNSTNGYDVAGVGVADLTLYYGKWYRFVGTLDFTNHRMRMYLDSKLIYQKTLTSTAIKIASGTYYTKIGAGFINNTENIGGSIDEVIADNAELQPSWIKNDYARLKGFF